MFICLCLGVTRREVTRAVESGASTSKDVASMCGAGSECGRCRPTVRAIIASAGEQRRPQVGAVDTASTSVRSRRALCGNRIDTTMHAV